MILPRLPVIAASAIQGAAALWIANAGPAGRIPVHFGLDGRIDRWGDRTEVAIYTAGIAALTLLVGWALEAGAAHPDADEARRRGLAWANRVMLASTSILTALGLALTFAGDRLAGPGGQSLVLVAVCALFVVLGAIMGKVAPNAFVGVRTPWSLNSKLAWEKSNRLAGRLFFWGGLAGMLAAPFAPQPLGMAGLIGGVLVIGVVTVFESWRVWRADPERRLV